MKPEQIWCKSESHSQSLWKLLGFYNLCTAWPPIQWKTTRSARFLAELENYIENKNGWNQTPALDWRIWHFHFQGENFIWYCADQDIRWSDGVQRWHWTLWSTNFICNQITYVAAHQRTCSKFKCIGTQIFWKFQIFRFSSLAASVRLKYGD